MSVRHPDTCSAPYRVRFDEAGPDGLLRTSVLLRLAQDLAWHHSAADVWPAQHGWSFRVLDHAGRDLLRARLEPGTSATTAAM